MEKYNITEGQENEPEELEEEHCPEGKNPHFSTKAERVRHFKAADARAELILDGFRSEIKNHPSVNYEDLIMDIKLRLEDGNTSPQIAEDLSEKYVVGFVKEEFRNEFEQIKDDNVALEKLIKEKKLVYRMLFLNYLGFLASEKQREREKVDYTSKEELDKYNNK